MTRSLLTLLFSLASLGGLAQAQDCSDQGSTHLDALTVDGPLLTTCDQFITFAGIRILLPGPRCVSFSVHYPALDLCAGQRKLRADCVPDSDVLATLTTRTCVASTRSGNWFQAVRCIAAAPVPLGLLAGGKEVPCELTCDPNGRTR